MITAAAAQAEVLNPALDARALNLVQERLLFNPSPEIDSLVECVQAVCRVNVTLGADLLNIVRRIMQANQAEGLLEQRLAGTADALVTDLRRAERNDSAHQPLTKKAVARLLAEPLTVLVDNTAGRRVSSRRLVRARGAVRDVTSRVSRTVVLSLSVRNDLGVARFSELCLLMNEDGASACDADAVGNIALRREIP